MLPQHHSRESDTSAVPSYDCSDIASGFDTLVFTIYWEGLGLAVSFVLASSAWGLLAHPHQLSVLLS